MKSYHLQISKHTTRVSPCFGAKSTKNIAFLSGNSEFKRPEYSRNAADFRL